MMLETTLERLGELFQLSRSGSGVVRGLTDLIHPQKDHLILIDDFLNKKKQAVVQTAIENGNCFLVSEKDREEIVSLRESSKKSFLFSQKLKLDFVRLLNYFNPYPTLPLAGSLPVSGSKEFDFLCKKNGWKEVQIGPNCIGGNNLSLGVGSCLMGGVFVGHGVKIGSRVTVHPNVVIHHGTVIGDDVTIHAGSILGSDGFGYERIENEYIKVPQIGQVIVGSGVEIGANCTIDRATVNATIIGDRVKIDNLVQIAHNVKLGDDCLIVSQSGIAGSSILEDGVVLGGQVGISDHVRVGSGVKIGAQSGVMPGKEIPPGTVYFGSPALPYRDRMKIEIALKKLVEKN